MYRQFESAEFYVLDTRSWLKQFEYAMSMRETNPSTAVRYFTDSDLTRWQSICDNIKDIREIYIAIEFLGEQLDVTPGCCTPRHRQIEKAIRVMKKAGYTRFKQVVESEINELNDAYDAKTYELEVVKKKMKDKSTQEDEFRTHLDALRDNGVEAPVEFLSKYSELQQEILLFYRKELELKDTIKYLDLQRKMKRRVLANMNPF